MNKEFSTSEFNDIKKILNTLDYEVYKANCACIFAHSVKEDNKPAYAFIKSNVGYTIIGINNKGETSTIRNKADFDFKSFIDSILLEMKIK